MAEETPQRPRLVAVGDPPDDDPTEATSDPDDGEGQGGGLLFWLLFVAAIAAVAGLAVQTQRAGELQAANEKLAGELFTARSALGAYQARFDEVRTSVGGLRAEIEQLNALVSADPLTPPAAPGAAADAAEPANAPADTLPAE